MTKLETFQLAMDEQYRDNEALELLKDELEYLQLKGDFFEDQTDLWGKLIIAQELKNKESLEEEQELIGKLNERKIEKEKLISHLKALKDQIKAPKNKSLNKEESVLIRINGYFNCTECRFKSYKKWPLKVHIDAIHLKLKPFKCSNCDKGRSINLIIFNLFF